MYKFKCRHWFEKTSIDVKVKQDKKQTKVLFSQYFIKEIHIFFELYAG